MCALDLSDSYCMYITFDTITVLGYFNLTSSGWQNVLFGNSIFIKQLAFIYVYCSIETCPNY